MLLTEHSDESWLSVRDVEQLAVGMVEGRAEAVHRDDSPSSVAAGTRLNDSAGSPMTAFRAGGIPCPMKRASFDSTTDTSLDSPSTDDS